MRLDDHFHKYSEIPLTSSELAQKKEEYSHLMAKQSP
jgi:hypothetical protein